VSVCVCVSGRVCQWRKRAVPLHPWLI
jgi:hypothetical protein